MRILLAHPGTQYAPRLAEELAKRGLLYSYWTTMAFAKTGAIARCAPYFPPLFRRAVCRRIIANVSSQQLRTSPRLEITTQTRLRLYSNSEQVLYVRNRQFQSDIPEAELRASSAIIAFDTSAWLLAERAIEVGTPLVLDQSIGHPAAKEKVYSYLRAEFPAWQENFVQKSLHLRDLEEREHALAKYVVAPSAFVAGTLRERGAPDSKIRINPFGTDLDVFHPPCESTPTDKTIFLYAGAINARKGLPILLNAWLAAELKNAELWIAGAGEIPKDALARSLPTSIRLLGKKTQTELADLMRAAHIFVFPSFFEGLAQVQIEALASGLPVLGTYESGATEIVDDGVNGQILPSGDVEAWTEALRQLAADPDKVQAMRRAVLLRRNQLSWSAYGDRWQALLNSIVPS